MRYAELHCLSNFSFLRGASHARELVQRARELDYAALAITDECSMAGIVRAHQAAKAHGVKLITGTEVTLEDGVKLVLLARNHDGYTQLCQLITQGRRRSAKGRYRLTRADLAGGLPDCFVLWVPPREPQPADARWIAQQFGERARIAIELHREAGDAQRRAHLSALGAAAGLALVAAGDVHMHLRSRRALQDVMTAIRHGCTVAAAGFRLFANGERHLRSIFELAELHEERWIEEGLRVAEACTFTLDELRYEYPHELVPAGRSAIQHLRALTEEGARRRWPAGTSEAVRATLEKELTLIEALKYEHFFLTVHDIVVYARSRGILCQGRGSAANSAVCFALGVTEVDPARMNMLFERFLSKERDEPPDIDVDFEHERREEVIQYVYARYGRERCALAATVICYRPKSAIRDVGKVLGVPLADVDRLSKSHAWWDGPEALPERLREQGFDVSSRQVRLLVSCVGVLLGFPRHLSQHVGGFVISEHSLAELVPVENAAMPDRTIIQWDKDDLEALGLLKVDCLALGMLTAIRKTLDLLNKGDAHLYRESGVEGKRCASPLSVADIPPEDPATYDMICAAKTMGVFQIESRAQMSMLPRLQPRNFYDLVIEVAIVRPGPIQGKMVHPFLRRRQGIEKVEYPSEALKRVLERTLGVPIFQEQVMQIAVVAAGFTPGEADQLRRAMAAWKRSGGLEPFHDKLIRGMAERGYTAEFSGQIYQQLRGFADYGFPESHSASFALLVYFSAWLRCHHLAAFTAGLLNSQPMGFYPPSMLVREAQRNGVEVRGVDVSASDWDCTLEKRPGSETGEGGAVALRLGLRQVSGLSKTMALAIVAARGAGAFTGVEDLVNRAGLDEKARRLLADAGALASIAGHRHAARWAALGAAQPPGFLRGHAAPETAAGLRAPSEGEDIAYDYEALGLTLGRHPLALLRSRLDARRVLRATDLEGIATGQPVRVGGIVMFRQRPGTASGVVFVSLEDETGIVNLIVWPKVVEQQRIPLLDSRLMLVAGELQKEGGVTHVIAQRIVDASRWLGGIAAPSRDFH